MNSSIFSIYRTLTSTLNRVRLDLWAVAMKGPPHFTNLQDWSLITWGNLVSYPESRCRGLFVAASHQTGLDTRSKARRPIKVGDKGEGKVGNEPRFEPCWSMLLIVSLSAMWAWWGKQFHEPKCGSGHVCWVMAWTRHQGLVPYIGSLRAL